MIKVDVEAKQAIKKLIKISKYFTSPNTGLGKSLAESRFQVFFPILEEKFENEGTVRGSGKWDTWSSNTIAARLLKLRYYKTPAKTTDKILQWSGRLKDSVTKERHFDSVYRKNTFGNNIVITLGTTVPYAKKLHEGDSSKHLPARPIYVANDFKDKFYSYMENELRMVLE